MTAGRLRQITPQAASRGATGAVPDADLPMLAALWLDQGYDSDELRELAGLTRRDGTEARRMLDAVLGSLGHPPIGYDNPWDQAPWHGYWDHIAWANDAMDHQLSPYAAAQQVLEVASDVPDL